MSSARMVSLDTSTNKSGCALFVRGQLEEYNLIDLSKMGLQLDDRINEMGRQLIGMLNHWKPSMVFIEEPKGHQNIELVRKLSEVLGIIRGWCIQNGAYYGEIKPSEWRKYCGLDQGGKKRVELKAASVEYVKTKYGIEVNDDTADAICIGDAVVNRYK